jgi:hypothetical protein
LSARLDAIRRAYKWSMRGKGELPTSAAFIKDVKLAIGPDVMQRRQLLVEWPC